MHMEELVVNFQASNNHERDQSCFYNSQNICILSDAIGTDEDSRILYVRKISYGFILPIICVFGIIGNILNLIVLTRRNMQGTSYIYMRAYSLASLLAILFCIPFTFNVLIHKESGGWNNWLQAFYHVHLEFYLGNGCLGVGVMMLSALTVERHASVCRLGRYGRPVCGPARSTAAALLLTTFLVYLPSAFKSEIRSCALEALPIYHKCDNPLLLQSPLYQAYKVMLEVLFKIGPTILIAVLNLRILLVYKRSCKRRRQMTRCAYDAKGLSEEGRLTLLLGSTSILFLVCVSPMVILHVTLSENNLSLLYYQIFRSVANLLEVINYSLTFYIYCFFSKDFRNTFIDTLKWSRARRTKQKLPRPRDPAKALSDATAPSSLPGAQSRPTTITTSSLLSSGQDIVDHRLD